MDSEEASSRDVATTSGGSGGGAALVSVVASAGSGLAMADVSTGTNIDVTVPICTSLYRGGITVRLQKTDRKGAPAVVEGFNPPDHVNTPLSLMQDEKFALRRDVTSPFIFHANTLGLVMHVPRPCSTPDGAGIVFPAVQRSKSVSSERFGLPFPADGHDVSIDMLNDKSIANFCIISSKYTVCGPYNGGYSILHNLPEPAVVSKLCCLPGNFGGACSMAASIMDGDKTLSNYIMGLSKFASVVTDKREHHPLPSHMVLAHGMHGFVEGRRPAGSVSAGQDALAVRSGLFVLSETKVQVILTRCTDVDDAKIKWLKEQMGRNDIHACFPDGVNPLNEALFEVAIRVYRDDPKCYISGVDWVPIHQVDATVLASIMTSNPSLQKCRSEYCDVKFYMTAVDVIKHLGGKVRLLNEVFKNILKYGIPVGGNHLNCRQNMSATSVMDTPMKTVGVPYVESGSIFAEFPSDVLSKPRETWLAIDAFGASEVERILADDLLKGLERVRAMRLIESGPDVSVAATSPTSDVDVSVTTFGGWDCVLDTVMSAMRSSAIINPDELFSDDPEPSSAVTVNSWEQVGLMSFDLKGIFSNHAVCEHEAVIVHYMCNLFCRCEGNGNTPNTGVTLCDKRFLNTIAPRMGMKGDKQDAANAWRYSVLIGRTILFLLQHVFVTDDLRARFPLRLPGSAFRSGKTHAVTFPVYILRQFNQEAFERYSVSLSVINEFSSDRIKQLLCVSKLMFEDKISYGVALGRVNGLSKDARDIQYDEIVEELKTLATARLGKEIPEYSQEQTYGSQEDNTIDMAALAMGLTHAENAVFTSVFYPVNGKGGVVGGKKRTRRIKGVTSYPKSKKNASGSDSDTSSDSDPEVHHSGAPVEGRTITLRSDNAAKGAASEAEAAVAAAAVVGEIVAAEAAEAAADPPAAAAADAIADAADPPAAAAATATVADAEGGAPAAADAVRKRRRWR